MFVITLMAIRKFDFTLLIEQWNHTTRSERMRFAPNLMYFLLFDFCINYTNHFRLNETTYGI